MVGLAIKENKKVCPEVQMMEKSDSRNKQEVRDQVNQCLRDQTFEE
jgi:hypothetical protein